MKKLFFVSALVLIAGIVTLTTLSSFSNKKTLDPVKAWFECIDPAHPEDSVSYIYLSGQSPDCSGSDQVCAIYADVANSGDPSSAWKPVESATMTSENSLEQLATASYDFTFQTDDVRLEED